MIVTLFHLNRKYCFVFVFQGNIRVFCRVRPLIHEEIHSQNGVISHINFPDLDSKVLELDQVISNGLNEVSDLKNFGLNAQIFYHFLKFSYVFIIYLSIFFFIILF